MRPVFGTLVAPLLALSALAVGGCGSDSGTEPLATGSRASRTVWEARDLRSYSYLLRVNAFSLEGAAGAVRVEVTDGVPTVIAPAGGEIPQGATFERFDTIPELFGLIEDAEARNAVVIRAEYDPAYGYPSDVYIDYEGQLADDEFGFVVTDFQPL